MAYIHGLIPHTLVDNTKFEIRIRDHWSSASAQRIGEPSDYVMAEIYGTAMEEATGRTWPVLVNLEARPCATKKEREDAAKELTEWAQDIIEKYKAIVD